MSDILNLPPVENHPLEPFLPSNAVLLMLGSFPPQQKRWSMDFFYPNLQNDMWRIFGLIFFENKDHFLLPHKKAFDKEGIISFLQEKGIALYDTASAVRRLQDNASDKFLEIVEPTDIGLLLKQLPRCQAIVTTGQKQPIRCACNCTHRNLPLELKPVLNTKTGNFLSTECPHPAVPIR